MGWRCYGRRRQDAESIRQSKWRQNASAGTGCIWTVESESGSNMAQTGLNIVWPSAHLCTNAIRRTRTVLQRPNTRCTITHTVSTYSIRRTYTFHRPNAVCGAHAGRGPVRSYTGCRFRCERRADSLRRTDPLRIRANTIRRPRWRWSQRPRRPSVRLGPRLPQCHRGDWRDDPTRIDRPAAFPTGGIRRAEVWVRHARCGERQVRVAV